MSPLVSAIIAFASLMAGSGLTILGQSLTDKRTLRRERIGRREEFINKNFEVQRDALFRLQETLASLAQQTREERTRREISGEYKYFDGQPQKRIGSAMMQTAKITKHISALSKEGEKFPKKQFLGMMNKESREMLRASRNMYKLAEEFSAETMKILDARKSFSLDLRNSLRALQIDIDRSGSNSVMEAGNGYFSALLKWNGRLVSNGNSELYDDVIKAEHALRFSISKALSLGPYDGT